LSRLTTVSIHKEGTFVANPVLSRPDTWTHNLSQGQAPQQPNDQSYGAQYGQPYTQYGQQPPAGQPVSGQQQYVPSAPLQTERMTVDDVITKTAITMGIMMLVAVAAARFIPFTLLLPVAMVSGLVAFIVPLVVAVRRSVGPVLAITFALIEGVFIGGFSMLFERYYPGIVLQAVLGTFVAAAITLAAFKFGGFRLSSKVRKIVMLSMIGVVVASLLSFALSFFGINLGLYAGVTGSVGGLAWLFAGLGVVLAVLSLVDDFQSIEQGIAVGAPAKESWRAAFGLTVTMVWLYTNILRILSYIRR
jgi:uncharacterized YccA/Bax inhibitor family protein